VLLGITGLSIMFARVVVVGASRASTCSSFLLSRPAVGVGRGVTGSHSHTPSLQWQCRMYQKSRIVASTDVDSRGGGASKNNSKISHRGATVSSQKRSQHGNYKKPRGTTIAERIIDKGEQGQQQKSTGDYPESVVGKGKNNNNSNNNNNGNTKNTPKLPSGGPPSTVYVHPLSQIILQHLQNTRHDWVSKVGLDAGGLTLNRDGTFVMRFPTPPDAEAIIDVENSEAEKENSDEDSELVDEKMRGGKLW
jgi:hypothetical protein